MSEIKSEKAKTILERTFFTREYDTEGDGYISIDNGISKDDAKEAVIIAETEAEERHGLDAACDALAIGKLKNRLDNIKNIVKNSFKPLSKENKRKRYYLAECGGCGWWGSSRLLNGGEWMPGCDDYDDCYCPICGNAEIEDKGYFEEEKTALRLEELYEEHEKELQKLKDKAVGAFILSCSCGVKQAGVGSATMLDFEKCRHCNRYDNFLIELNK